MHRVARVVFILVISSLALGTATAPARGQALRLRFWDTPRREGPSYYYVPSSPAPRSFFDTQVPGRNDWPSILSGVEYRSRPNRRFLWSLTYDVGTISELVSTEGGFGAPGSHWFFTSSLHYLISPPGSRGQVTVFAGYGSGALQVDGFGSPRTFSTGGLRYGADLLWPIRGNVYLSGWIAYGDWPITHTWALAVPSNATGSTWIRDYGVVVGKLIAPTVALEVGYRGIYWTTTAIPGTACPCALDVSGYFLSLGFRPP
ncbi:MAG: hypothetical protein HY355_05405 [Armatimonadetes bacterium]|nr:hypothetical protein [Armatimonadota bacterium]